MRGAIRGIATGIQRTQVVQWIRLAAPALVLTMAAAACTTSDGDAADPPATADQPVDGSTAASGTTTPDERPTDDGPTANGPASTQPEPPSEPPAQPEESAAPELPPVRYAVSLPALMRKDYEGRGLRLGAALAEYSTYTRYAVTYLSGDLRISGIMNVPDGNGPFPVLILNHGYIDPAYYVTGQGLAREQDFLARRGYVVLHTDYRNHAGSDDDPTAERRMRLGYTEDVINAVLAVKRSPLPFLDGDRVGLLGRSMGGGVTLNALVVRAGSGRRGNGLRVGELEGHRQLQPVPAGRPGGRQRLRFSGVGRAEGESRVLAWRVLPTLFRPDHRAGADAPRHGR